MTEGFQLSFDLMDSGRKGIADILQLLLQISDLR
jgi:hypothetical protein